MNFEEELEAMQANLRQLHKKERKLRNEQEKLISETIGANPCPFCSEGSVDADYDYWQDTPGWSIHCNHCSARTPECSTVSEALEHWNAMVAVRQRHRGVE